MKVWSYIYLGRIFDLECNRDTAVEYYQQAVKVGDNSQNAQAAASRRRAEGLRRQLQKRLATGRHKKHIRGITDV